MNKHYRKYSNLMYGNYLGYVHDPYYDILPLAPPDWEASAKKQYIINISYLPTHVRQILDDPRIEQTFYVLNKLTITEQNNTVIQLVVIKNQLYLNPYFKGINENIFFNSYCHIPDLGISDTRMADIELKVKMLGGMILKECEDKVDILICPRVPNRKNMLAMVDKVGAEHFKNIIVTSAILNQIFRQYFINYSI